MEKFSRFATGKVHASHGGVHHFVMGAWLLGFEDSKSIVEIFK